jgi:hypothetical protein
MKTFKITFELSDEEFRKVSKYYCPREIREIVREAGIEELWCLVYGREEQEEQPCRA